MSNGRAKPLRLHLVIPVIFGSGIIFILGYLAGHQPFPSINSEISLPPQARTFVEGLKIPAEFLYLPRYKLRAAGELVPADEPALEGLVRFQGQEAWRSGIFSRSYGDSESGFWGNQLSQRLKAFRHDLDRKKSAASYFNRNQRSFDTLVLPLLERLLRSHDPYIRLEACGTLIAFGHEGPSVQSCLKDLLNQIEQRYDRRGDASEPLEGYSWFSERIDELVEQAGLELASHLDQPIFHIGTLGESHPIEPYLLRTHGSHRFGTSAIHHFGWLDPSGDFYTTWSGEYLYVWETTTGILRASHREPHRSRIRFAPLRPGQALRFERSFVQRIDLLSGERLEEARYLDLSGEEPSDRGFADTDDPIRTFESADAGCLGFVIEDHVWLSRDGTLGNLKRFPFRGEFRQFSEDGKFLYSIRRKVIDKKAHYSFERLNTDTGAQRSLGVLDRWGPWEVSKNGKWLANLVFPEGKRERGEIRFFSIDSTSFVLSQTLRVPVDQSGYRAVRLHPSEKHPDDFHLLLQSTDDTQSQRSCIVNAHSGQGESFPLRFAPERIDGYPTFDPDQRLLIAREFPRFRVYSGGDISTTIASSEPYRFFGISRWKDLRLLCSANADGQIQFTDLDTGMISETILPPFDLPSEEARWIRAATHRESSWFALSTDWNSTARQSGGTWIAS